MARNRTIVCPRCGEVTQSTRHHIFPKRHFTCGDTEDICRSCHDELEYGIQYAEKVVQTPLPKVWYVLLWESFIGK
jgi:deoxycytidylate deaminase